MQIMSTTLSLYPPPPVIFRPTYVPKPMIDLDFDGCDDDDDVGVVLPTKLYIPNPNPELCIPSTLNTDCLLWHTQLIVCALNYQIIV